jgi:hypothetical protein
MYVIVFFMRNYEYSSPKALIGKAFVAASMLVAASCTSKHAEAEPKRETWSLEAPSAPSTVETTMPALPLCRELATVALAGDFTTTFMKKDTDYIMLGTISKELDTELPAATPAEYANAFIAKALPKLNGQIKVVIDESLALGTWGVDIDHEKAGLLYSIDDIVSELSRYPEHLFSSFGVRTLRLTNKYKNFGGDYNSTADTIDFEYDTKSANSGWIYKFLAHELAHAYHDKYCGGNDSNDPVLSSLNTFGYIGYIKNEDTNDQIVAHNNLIPPKLYEYGPQREFVVPYSTSSVQEDFATIVDWTLSDRGIIQPEDADFDSPLYHKQKLVLIRLESMIPGITNFIDGFTASLRFNPDNEIYTKKRPIVELNIKEVIDLVKSGPAGNVLLNGIRSSSERVRPYTQVLPFPRLKSDKYRGTLDIPDTMSSVFASYNSYDPAERGQYGAINLFVPTELVKDGVYIGNILIDADTAGTNYEPLKVGTSIDSSNTDNIPSLKELLYAGRLTPISVVFKS